jgi:predicted nucleic acid-binding protein
MGARSRSTKCTTTKFFTFVTTTLTRSTFEVGRTVYDAAYLELARRRELPLATLDEDLSAAASALGIHVLGGGT